MACALESKSIGDPAESSDSSDSDTGTPSTSNTATSSPPTGTESDTVDTVDTVDPVLCPDNPLWECTVPFDGGWPCGESPIDDLDENCCPRPTCASDDECEDGYSCQPIGSSGFGCIDFPTDDGGLTCSCAANPTSGRNICIPDTSVEINFCENLFDAESCEAAADVQYDPEHAYYCIWATVHTQVLAEDGSSCSPGFEAEQKCVTASRSTVGGDPGCGVNNCSVGDIELQTGVARLVGDLSIEYISSAEYVCGSDERLAGEQWLPCDDPTFGPCACTCD